VKRENVEETGLFEVLVIINGEIVQAIKPIESLLARFYFISLM
jgi:hypothetical protein